MKIIDFYILRKFLATFFFMLGIIMLIAIIFDISERIDDFLRSEAPLNEIILDYYVNFVIFYGNLFSSLLIFISVIFFTATMASKTEIVAILISGVSFKRMLVPYLIGATLLASVSYYLNHWVLPKANKSRLAFENTYLRNPYRNRNRNIHKQINPGEFIYFESFNNERNIGYKFSLEKWEGNVLKYKLNSNFIRWDTISQRWRIENYAIRTIDGLKETLTKGMVLDTVLDFSPEAFGRRMSRIEMMNTAELDAFIEQQQLEGSDLIPYYKIERHQRTSYPFATYILTLIGVCIASRKVRGGIGLHIAYGMLICVSYILAMKVTTVYATNAGLDPIAAVWLPNVLFALFAIFLFKRAPK